MEEVARSGRDAGEAETYFARALYAVGELCAIREVSLRSAGDVAFRVKEWVILDEPECAVS